MIESLRKDFTLSLKPKDDSLEGDARREKVRVCACSCVCTCSCVCVHAHTHARTAPLMMYRYSWLTINPITVTLYYEWILIV